MEAITALIAYISQIWHVVLDYLNWTQDFIFNGLYDFAVAAYAEYVKYAVVAQIEFKLFAIQFAWDVGKSILDSLNISAYINQAFAMLDIRVLNLLTFFRFPEVVNIILSAAAARFVLRFMGVSF